MTDINMSAEIEHFKKSAGFAQAQENEEEVISRFQLIFTPDNLDSLTAEAFKSFLLPSNNKHWWGIHRHGGHLTEDMDHLRGKLRILLDENRTLKDRLDELFPKGAPSRIKFLGRAVATPILLVTYPDRYGVYNRQVEVALKALRLYPEERGLSFADRYVKVNEVISELAEKHNISRFLLDHVFERITSKVEAKPPVDRPKKPEAEATLIPEHSLRDLLVARWANLPHLNEYEIYEEDGEEAVEYSTGEVGKIDILARHPKSNDWLVVELKKGHASDTVVGQILRYKGWVKENRVEQDETVRGLIVAAEPDQRLRYAISQVPDVEVLLYDISVSLNSPDW